MNDLWTRLRQPFPEADIQWRVGSRTKDGSRGLALAYLDARAVRRRLNEVLGPDGWSVSYRAVPYQNGCAYICRLEIQVGSQRWLAREDSADVTDIESAKGGASDAFKRAAATFGIGEYLYGLKEQWVPLKDGRYLAETPRLPEWALPLDSPTTPTPQHTPEPPDGMPASDWTPDTSTEPPISESAGDEMPWGGEATSSASQPHGDAALSICYWKDPQGDAAPNALVQPAHIPDDGSEPPWFDAEMPGKKYKGNSWRYMTQGGPGGDRYNYLQFIVEKMAPPKRKEYRGKWYDPKPEWIAQHNENVARAKAALIYIENRA